ncbi:hypothetical protein Theam_1025 [Thermovibrio ammonificans HB-1]|uniref:Lipoprotein n=1 Tax=Thermovibrio ammonificans (strain DSM 15698 / JCM 12110 / HB-1) TaxID=648996 RepID=E8T297_THEA1|nr:hypothetical protein [Thermovibrio ammonificans]ADU96992.1 hypothetical protein Theam_1025 [Thermovibrio ammonificans HB-1]
MRRSVIAALSLCFLVTLQGCSSQISGSIGTVISAVKGLKQKQEQPQKPRGIPFSGEVVITDDSKEWFFKPLWFDAGAASRVYYQVNSGKPVFLVEGVGPKPKVGAPIPIRGLKKGDRVRFLVKTCQGERWIGPVYSTNKKFFKALKEGKGRYYFQYEDAVGWDMGYNDGAFLFYQKGNGPEPNRFVRIEEFTVYKSDEGPLFKGVVWVGKPGRVEAEIVLRDSSWGVYKVVKLPLEAQRAGEYRFSYTFKGPLPDPMYTAIFKVRFKGESDARVRGVKGCVDSI